MASVKETGVFFSQGSSAQFEYVLGLYPQVLKLKAQSKCKRPDDLIQLDDWYQSKLPQLIRKRGKDRYVVHEELVKTMKWKQTRGKFFPQLSYLIKVNTPRAVQAETRKAFRKLPNLEQAITALSNLKGVGITMASALLAAAAPETAPFMADECLMAIPEIEGIDYTTREYMNFVKHIRITTDRLNRECHPDERPDAALEDETKGEGSATTSSSSSNSSSGIGSINVTTPASKDKSTASDGNGSSHAAADGSEDGEDSNSSRSSDGSSADVSLVKNKPDPPNAALTPQEKKWSPHRVELALWTHYVANELQPELLEHIPENGESGSTVTDSEALTKASATCSTHSVHNHNDTDSTQSSGGTNGRPTLEERADKSNGDTDHGKGRLGTDEPSKDNKILANIGDCTEKEENSREKSNLQDTVSSRQHSPPQEHVVSCPANNNSSRTDGGSGDSPSNPKRTLADDEGEEEEEESASPACKKSKFG
ncbi:uncharacterized protein LOC125949036 [Anopheles darlingi]|uniref:uncharacterized protein LOC125949036 n=1 Tax=Anopheles darlingi TaxID=43151 RepID=UPI0021000B2D|nr:uncharacterized protein LOC125949036 [Anopheles darlingi]XP_049531678.1 uncharacterized protein LOC125949036 [Anopheles darlingi]XP_049531679.1 uncharacterized protein LOC125949036 [Anopheles darlingi]XP_049531680.1 uncharacterized protein LOC125949036 [Anopheles darlingi]